MSVLDELLERNAAFFAAPCQRIRKFIDTQHWFELGAECILLLDLPGISGDRLRIYESLICRFDMYMNAFHLAQIIYIVSNDFTSPSAATEFLETAAPKVAGSVEASHWLKLQVIGNAIVDGNLDESKVELLEMEKKIGAGTPLSVRTLFYRISLRLDKARSDFDSFYEHGLLYLSTSSRTNDLVLAHDICSSAICSRRVFSFGEIAAHDIMNSLVDTPNEWLRDLIHLMERGVIECVQVYHEKFVGILKSTPQFVPFLELIELKVRLCILQELISQRPLKSRVFEFDELATACAVPKNKVEPLVIKALAEGLIRGFIDEVTEQVVVTWCKVKTMSPPQLVHLKQQVDKWLQVVHEQKILVEISAQQGDTC